MANQDSVYRLRLSAALLKKGQKKAKEDGRTLANLIRLLLVKHLEGK
jgi:hypothetical protein